MLIENALEPPSFPPMTPRQRKLLQEISTLDHPGEVLEALAAEAGLLNAPDFIDAMIEENVLAKDHHPKVETVRNWFKTQNPPTHLNAIIRLFKKKGVIPDKPNSAVEKHIKLLYYGSQAIRARRTRTGVKATVTRLIQLDKRLEIQDGTLVTSGADLELLVERQNLISRLESEIDEAEDPVYVAGILSQLLHLTYWNAPGLVRAKTEYLDIADRLYRRLDGISDSPAFHFATEYARLAYLAGETGRTADVLRHTLPLVLAADNALNHQTAVSLASYAMSETDYQPDDIADLTSRPNDAEANALNRAADERCKGCSLLSSGELDKAADHLAQAESHLGRVSTSSRQKSEVRIYLDALGAILAWRRYREPTPEIEEHLRSIIDRVSREYNEDTPLLASLLMIRLEIAQARSGLSISDRPETVEAITLALAITDLADRSVPGYCLFRMDALKDQASQMLARVSPV